MYQILIAEDEAGLLEAMCKATPWEQCGFDYPVGCADGQQAIEALEGGFVPDVVLTDICMPFVDGLELAAYVTEHCPQTIVVILTGYDDFKFAQNAIKLQVFDYELKPITPVRLQKLLGEIREELNVRRLRRAEGSEHLVQAEFLNRLVSRTMEPEEIQRKCKALGLSLGEGSLTAVALDVEDASWTQSEQSDMERELMRYGLFNIAKELMEGKPAVVFQSTGGLVSMLVSGEEEQALSYAGQVVETVDRWMHIGVYAGVGETVRAASFLHQSYRQAQKALGYRFFYSEQAVLRWSALEQLSSGDADCSDIMERMLKSLKGQKRAETEELISAIYHRLREKRVSLQRCLLQTQRVVMMFMNVTEELIGEQAVPALENMWNDASKASFTSLSQLEQTAFRLCAEMFSQFSAVRSDFTGVQVKKAESYIREHFADAKLSLNVLTEHLAISTSYFSAIFKAKTGATFVEYLTNIRMEKAKQLLAFTDLRTYETAEQVGFSDPHYFSVAFKRVTGMTPKEYREWSKQMNDS